MAFEQELRDKINSFPHGSAERNLLKVVLGDWQQKAVTGKVTDEIGHGIVKKIIEGNTSNLGRLPEGDARRAELRDELVGLSKTDEADDRRKEIIVEVGHLPEGDPRRATILHENKVLASLLPQYLTGDEISQRLVEGGVDLHSGNEGQATGRAMKFLKEQKAVVEGNTVKSVVIGLRNS